MASNRNKIVDPDTNYTKRTDLVYCNVPNVTNEDLSMPENHKFFQRVLKYLKRSTTRTQSNKKKFNIKKQSVSTSCKSEEKISVTSSIVSNITKSDAEAVAKRQKIKQKMIDAITSTTSSKVFDKATHLSEHFVHCAPYQYAEYAAKYVDNAIPERSCGPLCIGIETQSDIVDGEFSLETSPDAFAKACEKRRHTDFILKKIAKVSDALTEKARLETMKNNATSILASVSVTPLKCEMGEETFESTKPLTCSMSYTKEKPTAAAVAAASTTVIRPELHTEILVSSSSHFTRDSRDFSVCLDKSLDASDIQVIPSIKHLKKTEHTRTVSVMYPERDDLRDTAVTATVTKERKKEEKELLKKISLRRLLDKHIFADKTSCAAINSLTINCIPKLKKKISELLHLYQPSDVQTDASRQEDITAKSDTIDSCIKISQVEEEPTISKDIPKEEEFLPCERPKYRAKYRIDTSCTTKKGKKRKKLEKTIEDSDKIPKYGCLSFPAPEVTSKFFKYYERPTTYQDCRSVSSRYLQPTKYCDVWTTPCFSTRSEATLRYGAHCTLLQDSCATGYHASCHSLINSHALSRYCDIDANCAKHRVTFGNSLCTNTYCENDAKYCYPHLNNTDNVRMGYYHCNNIYSLWNNNQHCGRDRSCYWTKGNLHFTHPWTSEHLL